METWAIWWFWNGVLALIGVLPGVSGLECIIAGVFCVVVTALIEFRQVKSWLRGLIFSSTSVPRANLRGVNARYKRYGKNLWPR